MKFSSFNYILLFLPVVFIACQLARRLPIAKAPQICLLLASMFFYAWANPSHLAYLLGSILANWQIARLISGATDQRRKHYLQLGLGLNIAFLCIFKYLNFLIGSVPYFVNRHVAGPELAFPLGISFFTLAQIMYLVDCYEELIPASSLFNHATFVSFFPYVELGPISRSKRILHQFPALNSRTGPDADTLARAMFLFSLGLFKKVVFAEAFSQIADAGFSSVGRLSAVEAWCAVSAYSFQLYFDFSGYSDMAIASALFFGIEIPRNFDAPLRSLSMIEFWQRWHISLSAFITTYLYTPIMRAFNRATLVTSSIATLLAMTIAGLWHGPAWTFVIFGLLHGIGLVVNQIWKKKKMPVLPKLLSWVLTFALIDLAFVFFRSPNLETALLYLPRLVDWQHPFGMTNLIQIKGAAVQVAMFGLIQIVGVIAGLFGKSTDQLAREFKPSLANCAATVACTLLAWCYLNSSVTKPFVYFKF